MRPSPRRGAPGLPPRPGLGGRNAGNARIVHGRLDNRPRTGGRGQPGAVTARATRTRASRSLHRAYYWRVAEPTVKPFVGRDMKPPAREGARGAVEQADTRVMALVRRYGWNATS